MKDKFDKWLMVWIHKKISFVSMFRRNILKPVCILVFFLITGRFLQAQHSHFIYLQHDQSVPFYVKYQGQIFRSSYQGYLILSKLSRGVHSFYVGHNEGNPALLLFTIDSLTEDKGYLIKDFGKSGWGLFDLQQSQIIYAKKESASEDAQGKLADKNLPVNDPFGNMLADVTKDSTVKYVSVPRVEKKIDSVSRTPVKSSLDSFAVGVKSSKLPVDSVHAKPKPRLLSVKMIHQFENDTVRLFTFLVDQKRGVDTVKIVVELDREIVSPAIKSDTIRSAKTEVEETAIIAASDSNRVVVDVIVPAVSDSTNVNETLRNKSASQLRTNECLRVASEDDFIRLRKKMAGQRTEDKMIEEAAKAFRQTCFRTTQLGQLSVLLFSDEMKYHFFETAFKFVSDPDQFSVLRRQIQEEKYLQKFDALISNP
jgi:hypothetical protein